MIITVFSRNDQKILYFWLSRYVYIYNMCIYIWPNSIQTHGKTSSMAKTWGTVLLCLLAAGQKQRFPGRCRPWKWTAQVSADWDMLPTSIFLLFLLSKMLFATPKVSQIQPNPPNIIKHIWWHSQISNISKKNISKKNGLISGDACLPWELKEIQWRVWAVSRSRIPHQEVPGFLERVSTLQKA